MGKIVWSDGERIYSVEGDGVRMVSDEPDPQPDPRDVVLAFLDSIDGDMLSQLVLSKLDYATDPTVATLLVLKDLAAGA